MIEGGVIDGEVGEGGIVLPIGWSVQGRALTARSFGSAGGPRCVLIFAGIHGDEPGGVEVAEALVQEMAASAPSRGVVIAPRVNPDGLAVGRKNNAHDVDLNRNFPSLSWRAEHAPGYGPGAAPLSEPESAWLAEIVARCVPTCIVSLHQPLACVNFDGPADDLAARMAAVCAWPVVADIGYPTPGSFGACYGIDRGLPVVTLELPRPLGPEDRARALAALRIACAS